jgi:hypothetical protein
MPFGDKLLPAYFARVISLAIMTLKMNIKVSLFREFIATEMAGIRLNT